MIPGFVNTSQLGMNHGPLTKPFGGTSQHGLELFFRRKLLVFREGYSHHSHLEESPWTHIGFGDAKNDTKTSAPESDFGGAPREQITLLDPPSSKDSPQRCRS